MIPTRLRNHQLCRVRLPKRLRSLATETANKMCWHYWPPTNIREKCEDFGRFAPGRWHICQIAQIDFASVWEKSWKQWLGSLFVGYVWVRFSRIGIAVYGEVCPVGEKSSHTGITCFPEEVNTRRLSKLRISHSSLTLSSLVSFSILKVKN